MVRVERPPGPGGFATYAGLLRRRDPAEAFRALAREYPRLCHLRLGHEHVYVLNHPEPVTALFVTAGRSTRKGRSMEKIRLLLGDGLLTSEGPTHAERRRLIQPGLRSERVRAYAPHMVAAAAETTARWHDGEQLDLAREMSALTLTVVGRALFGDRLDQEAAEIAECVSVVQSGLGGFGRHLLPGADLLLALPTPTNRRMLRAAHRLDRLIRRLVAERESRAGSDLVSVLVSRMGPERARDEAMTLLLAGHETTATALTWTWWLLDGHPNVARWWRTETDREVDAGYDDPAELAERLPRTRAVLAEALRLYPPSWVLGRRLVTPVEVDGWTLPKGSLVVASQWALHRDPRFWDRASAFRPCRWLTDDEVFDESAPGQPKGAYLPFGLGARLCAGRPFAWLEGVLLLALLGREWEPRLVPDSVVEPLPAVTLRPRYGMPMSVQRR